MTKDGGAWTGFLIMAFVMLGLVGAMGIFAAQIPFERALAREAALDQVLQAAQAPDSAARLAALRPALGDSADYVLPGAHATPGDLPQRVASERVRMLAAFGQDAHDTGMRLRLVLAVFTAAGALIGTLLLGIARRAI